LRAHDVGAPLVGAQNQGRQKAHFAQRGGLGKANQVFGKDLARLLNEMNEVLAA
jgi:hypothetical protein